MYKKKVSRIYFADKKRFCAENSDVVIFQKLDEFFCRKG